MRLDPIFVLAPRPKPPSMSTRRAFLGMGIAFVTGGAIGSACGYAAGRSGQAKPVDSSTTEELQPTGNADLDEVRRLAVKAPIEELMGKAWSFLPTVVEDYPNDEIAWRGVGRIAQFTLTHGDVPSRRQLANFTAQSIEAALDRAGRQYQALIVPLREVK